MPHRATEFCYSSFVGFLFVLESELVACCLAWFKITTRQTVRAKLSLLLLAGALLASFSFTLDEKQPATKKRNSETAGQVHQGDLNSTVDFRSISVWTILGFGQLSILSEITKCSTTKPATFWNYIHWNAWAICMHYLRCIAGFETLDQLRPKTGSLEQII